MQRRFETTKEWNRYCIEHSIREEQYDRVEQATKYKNFFDLIDWDILDEMDDGGNMDEITIRYLRIHHPDVLEFNTIRAQRLKEIQDEINQCPFSQVYRIADARIKEML